MNKDDYIKSVTSKIKNKRNRAIVEQEISAHIDDEIEFYQSKGYDYDTACEKAVKSMGSSELVGAQLGKLHSGYKDKIIAAVMLIIYSAIFSLPMIFILLVCENAFNLFSVLFEFFVFSAFVLSVLLANKYKSRLILAISLMFTILYLLYKSIFGLADFHLFYSPLLTADIFVYTFDLDGFVKISNELSRSSNIALSLAGLLFYIGWIISYVYSFKNITDFYKYRYDLTSIHKEKKINIILLLALLVNLFACLMCTYAVAPLTPDDLLGDKPPYCEGVVIFESDNICDLEELYNDKYQNSLVILNLSIGYDYDKYANCCCEKIDSDYDLVIDSDKYGKGISYETYTLYGKYRASSKYVAVVPIHKERLESSVESIPDFEKSQWYEVSETSEITGRLDNDDLKSYYYKIEIVD